MLDTPITPRPNASKPLPLGLSHQGLQLTLTKLWIFLSVALCLVACQTTSQPDKATQQQVLLESQKALVRTALDSAKPDTALQSLRALVREFPQDPQIHNLMGLTQLALKNPNRSVRHFLTAYKLDKQGIYALNLSSAYIEGGEYDKAIKLLQAYLKSLPQPGTEADKSKIYPYRERMQHNIGYAYLKQKRLGKAQTWFQEAIDENPTFFPSYLELARVYEQTNRPAMALKTYRQSVDYCHVCFEPIYASSALLVGMNQHSEARKMILRFLKTEGIAAIDRNKANKLLKLVTTAGLKGRRAG